MQKIKDLIGKIKKSINKPTKKQKIVAYIVLGALIVGITVPAVYLNRGSLFKGQWGNGDVTVSCNGVVTKINDDNSKVITWTAKLNGMDVQPGDDKKAMYSWFDVAGMPPANFGNPTPVVYQQSAMKTSETVNVSNFGFNNDSKVSTTCPVINIPKLPDPSTITCKGTPPAKDGTVTWTTTFSEPQNTTYQVSKYKWTTVGVGINNTNIVNYKGTFGTVTMTPGIQFKYIGGDPYWILPSMAASLTVTGSKPCSVDLSAGDKAAAAAAAKAAAEKANVDLTSAKITQGMVSTQVNLIAGYLTTAKKAAADAAGAVATINGKVGLGITPLGGQGRVQVQPQSAQLTDDGIKAQQTIAKNASAAASAANISTAKAIAILNSPTTQVSNPSNDPLVKAIADQVVKAKATATTNALSIQKATDAAAASYKQAVTDGSAKMKSNAAKDKAAKDLAAQQAQQLIDAKKAEADAALAAQKADADAKLAAADKALDEQKAESEAQLAALQAAADKKIADAADAAAQQAADQAAQKAAADAADKLAADQAAQKAADDAAAKQAADQAAADAAAQQTPPQTSQLTKTLPTDISGHWAESIIKKAVDLGVVVTNANGLFNPNQPITRADVAVMAMRALAQTPTPCTNVQCGTTFNDNVGDLVTAGYIAKANSLGIIVNAQNFRPYATLTRAEAASILAKMIKYKDPTFHLRTPAECYYHAQWHWSCGTGAPNNIATDINADWEGQYFRSLWDYNPTIFQGKAPHIFAPEDQITNAEMLKIIMNAIRP